MNKNLPVLFPFVWIIWERSSNCPVTVSEDLMYHFIELNEFYAKKNTLFNFDLQFVQILMFRRFDLFHC